MYIFSHTSALCGRIIVVFILIALVGHTGLPGGISVPEASAQVISDDLTDPEVVFKKNFKRTKFKNKFKKKFTVENFDRQCVLLIDNGGKNGQFKKVKRGWVKLNGEKIIVKSDFVTESYANDHDDDDPDDDEWDDWDDTEDGGMEQEDADEDNYDEEVTKTPVDVIEKEVTLQENNKIKIKIKSKKKSGFTLRIFCEGDTGGGNNPPIAVASADQEGLVGDTITVFGSDSSDPDNDPLTYSWTLTTPTSSTAVLANPNAATTTFVADTVGTYTAQLIVNDGTEDSAPDNATIFISEPAPENQAPQVDAGADQTVTFPQFAVVGGTVTDDGLPNPPGETTVAWSLLSGPGMVNFSATTSTSTAAFFSDVGIYVLKLTADDNATTSEDTVTVTVEPEPIVNEPPELDAIGDQTVAVGSTLNLDRSATDPNNDPLTFSVAPLPLEQGMIFNVATGEFSFAPTIDQVGQFTVTFGVSDGEFSDEETIQITVENNGGGTAIAGQLLDTNEFLNGSTTPIVGATVSILNNPTTAVSDSQGFFTLTGIPSGEQIFDIDVSTAAPGPGGVTYAGFRELIVLQDGVTNDISRPFFLPQIDPAGTAVVDPQTTTVVENTNLNITVTVPPNTAKDEQGNDFTGTLSISEVPENLAPAALPDTLDPALLITIQPVGVTFDTPVPITFENVDNLEPGSEVDIWSIDPSLGQFIVVGVGEVTPDGSSIETISGGIRAADWHFPAPPPPSVAGSSAAENSFSDMALACPQDVGMSAIADVSSGNVVLNESLPTYQSLGRDRGLELVYNSRSADPRPIVSANSTILARSSAPLSSSVDLRVEGIDQGTRLVTDTTGLTSFVAEEIKQSTAFDASGYETGLVDYTMTVRNNFVGSSIGSTISDRAIINNQEASSLGAGWTFNEIQQLHIQDDGSRIVTEGDGNTVAFDVVTQGGLFDVGAGLFCPGNRSSNSTTTRGITTVSKDGDDLLIVEIEMFDAEPDELYQVELIEAAPTCGSDNFGRTGDFLQTNENGEGYVRVELQLPNSPEQNATLGDGLGTESVIVILDRVSGGGDIFSADPIFISDLGGAVKGEFSDLSENPDGTFTRTYRNGTQVVFDQNGLHIATIDRNGNETTYAYDAEDNLTTITDPTNQVTTLTYDNGLLSSITDPANRVTNFDHDSNGDLIRITDAMGEIREFAYDNEHRVTQETTKNGETIDYRYDALGRIAEIEQPGNVIERLLPAQSLGITGVGIGQGTTTNPLPFVRSADVDSVFTDVRGGLTRFETNRFGSPTLIRDAGNQEVTFVRDENDRVTQMTDARGTVTEFEYDENNNLVRRTEALGLPIERTTRFEYIGLFGLPTAFIDPTGATTTWEYDGNGNLTKRINVSGGELNLTYDAQGLVLTREDENSNRTLFGYDSDGNLTSIVNAEGATTTFVHDSAGNPTSITEAFGSPEARTTSFTYNDANLIETITDPATALTSFTYNEFGQLEIVELPTGEMITQTYDALGRLEERVNPVTGTTTFTYDAADNVETQTDALGAVTQFEYDPNGFIERVIDANLNVQTFEYDPNGNLTAVTDQASTTRVFAYDELNRQTRETSGEESFVRTFSYDSRDNLTTLVTPNSDTITLTYNALSRLEQVTTPDNVITYTYDGIGNVTGATDNDSSVTLTYDGLNRVETQSVPLVTLTSAFNAVGNRTTLSDSLGSFIAYGYDSRGLLESITSPTIQTITRTFDPTGRLDQVTYPNGIVGTYDFDTLGRLDSLVYALGTTSPIVDLLYGYNAVGNITGIDDGVAERSFGYNALQEVISGGTALAPETYTYDTVGNRTNSHLSASHVYGLDNRLLGNDDFIYTYDDNGNVVSKEDKATNDLTTYTYDAQDQLIQITRPDTSVVTYQYDGFGRRIGKNVAGDVTTYVYDGDDIVMAFNASGTLTQRFIHGNGVDEPLMTIVGGQTYFYHTDHLGSVTHLTDTSGTVVNSYEYDTFGQPTILTEAVTNPYTYTAREYDAESGLYYYRARYYDAETGRFMGEDPIGLNSNDLNFYRYVFNNSVNYTDASGLGVILGIDTGLFGFAGLGGGAGFTGSFIIGVDINLTDISIGAFSTGAAQAQAVGDKKFNAIGAGGGFGFSPVYGFSPNGLQGLADAPNDVTAIAGFNVLGAGVGGSVDIVSGEGSTFSVAPNISDVPFFTIPGAAGTEGGLGVVAFGDVRSSPVLQFNVSVFDVIDFLSAIGTTPTFGSNN